MEKIFKEYGSTVLAILTAVVMLCLILGISYTVNNTASKDESLYTKTKNAEQHYEETRGTAALDDTTKKTNEVKDFSKTNSTTISLVSSNIMTGKNYSVTDIFSAKNPSGTTNSDGSQGAPRLVIKNIEVVDENNGIVQKKLPADYGTFNTTTFNISKRGCYLFTLEATGYKRVTRQFNVYIMQNTEPKLH